MVEIEDKIDAVSRGFFELLITLVEKGIINTEDAEKIGDSFTQGMPYPPGGTPFQQASFAFFSAILPAFHAGAASVDKHAD